MPYPELEKELKNRALLYDEIKMWLRLGFYVSGESRRVISGSSNNWIDVVMMIDGAGNKLEIGVNMGRNIRMSVLSWWEVERVKPRAKEPIDNTGLSELESRNAV